VAICFVCYRSGNLPGGWSGPAFWDGSAGLTTGLKKACMFFGKIMMVYDIPVRKYFSDKRNARLAKQKTPGA